MMSVGHYGIFTSPEVPNAENVEGFNGDLHGDSVTFANFCVDNHLMPGPFTVVQGVHEALDQNSVYHRKSQCLMRLQEVANITNVANTWEIVFFLHWPRGRWNRKLAVCRW